MSENELISPLSVALLARTGPARERLREALVQAGASVVLEEDPNTLEADTLRGAGAAAVLVALEPAIEEALERLDPVLASPALTLIFDEAELAARREGWEAQRWARHLVAKLHGHQDVLPPGSEQEGVVELEPGLPVTPAELHADAPLDFHVREAFDAAPEVPADGLYPAREGYSEPLSLEEALAAMQAADVASAPVAPQPPAPPAVPAAAPATPAAAVGHHSSWSLVDTDDAPAEAAPVAASPEAQETPAADIHTGGLSLVELEPELPPSDAAPGAVLVLAGIGGPDALRRLLASLPAGLAVPVLVYMRLDGGRYGNLVKQMARVSALPVLLAESDQPVVAGNAYILPDDVGVGVQNRGLHFTADVEGVQVSALPAPHSAVVMLSGADARLVDDALSLAVAGGWVAGQTGEGCYDPIAASAVVAAGMAAGDPPQIAAAIAERWGVSE
ncbi:chemotaxis protein CheB [Stenotrophomonas sp.]|uniref:chemotaxis protein CheB n=1 Tax=Stenotrophomonas sp. TaxID=69392 RepID=UPI00289DB428|nr:chemotaxis protein CheB [Stenotrophomonas sp.]